MFIFLINATLFYLLRLFVTMSDASGSHIQPIPTLPFATNAPTISLPRDPIWRNYVVIDKDADRNFIVTCNWCSRQFSMKLSRAREHLDGFGKKVRKNKFSSFCNCYIVVDVTVVCYCSIIIVLSSLLPCVLSSVRVIGKES